MKELWALFHQMERACVTMRRDLAEIKSNMATSAATKKDFAALCERMDGFSQLLIESRHLWDVPSSPKP